ncbi:MAG: hypothetical protein FJX77_05170 [Armatimonadetes bacterium]|nr:hypothetical protein [Armatimonadota bacterium]
MPTTEELQLQRLADEFKTGVVSYDELKRRYAELGDQIRQQYERQVAVLSLDVVQSSAAKAEGGTLQAQLTFDAYHRIVEQTLTSHGCRSFHWAGDGVVAIFRSGDAATQAALAILEVLPLFNRYYNRLGRPFQIRAGLHAGPILPGEETGKVSSETFDIAGHLQKRAEPNQLLVSATAYRQLGAAAAGMTRAGVQIPGFPEWYVFPASPEQPARVGPAAQPSSPPVEATPRRAASPLPWILGGVGAGILLVAAALRILAPDGRAPALRNTAPVELSLAPFRQQPVAAPTPPTQARTPRPQNSATVATSSAAPAHREQRPRWEPSDVLWRSPVLTSGVPATLSPSPPDRKWILAVGAAPSLSSGWEQDGPAASARAVVGALQAAAGVPHDHVHLLVNQQVTTDSLRLAFRQLQGAAHSGSDTVYCYLAGSAVLAPDRPGYAHRGGVGYLFETSESPGHGEVGILGAELARWLAATRAQTILLFVDTPHGAAVDLPTLADPGRQFTLFAATEGLDAGIGMAARLPAPALSPFATTLTAGLQGQADLDRDGRVALAELIRYVAARVSRMSPGAQTPQVLSGFGGFIPEHYFIPAGRPVQ